jgi:hypothetical protein
MASDNYKHFSFLSIEDLIAIIEKKDTEISNLKKTNDEIKKSRDKYYAYNNFHIEEITRLDKIIGNRYQFKDFTLNKYK